MTEPEEPDLDPEFESTMESLQAGQREEPSEEAKRMAVEPIDWDIDVEDLRKKSPEELAQHTIILVEQLRRASNALLSLAQRFDEELPPREGQPSAIELASQELNPPG